MWSPARVPIAVWGIFYIAVFIVIFKTEVVQRFAASRFTLQEKPQEHSRQWQARNITAAELLSRPLATDVTSIPRLLHQSWKSDVLPSKFEQWSKGCRMQHPDWEWVLWTDADNLSLVRKYYPWLEASYNALPAEIYRADLVRTLYMHTFGGVYLDLDTDCLQPSEVLFEKYVTPRSPPIQTALVGRMGENPGFEHSIPNAWMAAPPAHPFFLVLPSTVDSRVQAKNIQGVLPESLTGPVALRDSIIAYETKKIQRGNSLGPDIAKFRHGVPFPNKETIDHQVTLLPSELIYPYSWGGDGEPYRDLCWVLKDTYNADRCKTALRVKSKGSVCITYWSHSHSPDGENEENMKHITRRGRL